jgi:predicted transcriptional regulator
MNTRKLRAEIQRTTQPNGRRHFSTELRARVKAAVSSLRETGASQAQIADTLSISPMTVGRYLRGRAAKVTTPSGFQVEGLDVSDIAILIRSLS